MVRDDVDKILKKYSAKLEGSMNSERRDYSREYERFRGELQKDLSWYERLCKNVGSKIKAKVPDKSRIQLSRDIAQARLDITPEEASGLSLVALILLVFLAILISGVVFMLSNSFPFLFMLLVFFAAIILFSYLNGMPKRMVLRWRLKASSQMVPAILYIVIYMKHTSNLERAIQFAADNLSAPLSFDLKKIFWDVQIGKYSTIKDSLDAYLETWRDYSIEFVESMHLIEGSLYEPSESRRIALLEKALEVMLDGIYDKMLHYTHDVKSPLTNVYMLGIVLPTLALALLPLASALMGGVVKWTQVMILFNVILPFLVLYITNNILTKRPGGYGDSEALEKNPDYVHFKNKKVYLKAFLIVLPLLLLSLVPLFWNLGLNEAILGAGKTDITFKEIGLERVGGNAGLFDYRVVDGKTVGPFGLLSVLFSLFLPLAIALFFSISYDLKTRKLMNTRKETQELEDQFSSSLFQLGNRLGDNIPAEIAFGRVANSLRGTAAANFFVTVNSNIQQVGMSVEQAIFNPSRGAIIYFPSDLIKTSMKIMIESVKKGLKVAANAMIAISNYIKNIKKINERLKDLLADVISDMKSNMSFLAPMLSGIVIGLSVMITSILAKLTSILAVVQPGEDVMVGGFASASTITQMFDITTMIPPYFLQIIIGVYLIEIIFILTKCLVTIQSGVDVLGEKVEIAKNLKRGMFLYFIITLIAVVALSLLAGIAIGQFGV